MCGSVEPRCSSSDAVSRDLPIRACRERGIKTVAVSAGYISPEPRIEFFRHMDAANIDLKGFTDGFYKILCSAGFRPFETLEYLEHETNVWFEITTLVIPGENDSSGEIEAESAWVMERVGQCAAPLHGVSSRLEADRPTADTAPDAARSALAACAIASAAEPDTASAAATSPANRARFCCTA